MAAKKAGRKAPRKAAKKKAARKAARKKTARKAKKKASRKAAKKAARKTTSPAAMVRILSPTAERALAKLRKIIEAWPETDERISHGSPTWWGGKKTFATIADNHHGDGRIAIWAKASFELQSDLVEADPDIFFVPPYVGPSGWVGIRVDRKVDWKMIEGVLEQGYRSVAPKRAIGQLDG